MSYENYGSYEAFGYFGKWQQNVSPPSENQSQSQGQPQPQPQPQPESQKPQPAPEPQQPQASPSPPPQPTGPSEADLIKQQLDALRAQVAQEKAEKTGEILRVQNVHRLQSRYTRDTMQARAKKAGYATESEKIMGGQTGYSTEGTPMGVKVPVFVPIGAKAEPDAPKQEPVMAGFADYLGQIAASTSQAVSDVAVATEDVRQTTEDVQKGVATRADLLRVMARLDEKVKIAKKLSAKNSALNGFADTSHVTRNLLLVAVGIAIAVLAILKLKK